MESLKELESELTPLQLQILVTALEDCKLMGNQPYWRTNEKGGIYRTLPNGRAVTPLHLAILNGIGAEGIKKLLAERERAVLEWRAKSEKEPEKEVE